MPFIASRHHRTSKLFWGGFSPLVLFFLIGMMGGCAADLAGTASGTENTVTLSLASFDDFSTPVARVRFHDAAALPKQFASRSMASTIEAVRSGDGFVAALPAGRLWTAELIGQDSSYRLWIDSCGSVEGAVRFKSGPLLRSVKAQGKLVGELGEERWIGVVGTDRFVEVGDDGQFELDGLVAANLQMVVARKLLTGWQVNTLEGWSRPTGEVEIPSKIELPKTAGALALWSCKRPSRLVESTSVIESPSADLFYTTLKEPKGHTLLQIDLCNGSWSRMAQVEGDSPLLLFSNLTGRWGYAIEADTLWDFSTADAAQAVQADYRSQIGLLSVAADENGFATYLYRPSGNRISNYGSLEQLLLDEPFFSFTPEKGDSARLLAAGNERLLLIDNGGEVRHYGRTTGEPQGTPWKLSADQLPLLGAVRAPSGRLVLLHSTVDGAELLVVEERTGETLLRVAGLPKEVSELSR